MAGKSAVTGNRNPGAGNREPGAAGFRGARLAILAIVAAAIAAWFAGGALARRAQAARIPHPPVLSGYPEGIRFQIAEADRAARADPKTGLGQLGMAYHASLLSAEAQRIYALAEAVEPGEWRWPYYRGLLHEERGEHDAAVAAFTRVTSIDPGHGLAWFHLGELALKQGRAEDARAAYRRAASSPPAATILSRPGAPVRPPVTLTRFADAGLQRLDSPTGDAPARDRVYVPPSDPWLDDVVARSYHTDLLLKHSALAARRGDREWRGFLARQALVVSPEGLDVLMEMASMFQDAGQPAEALEFLKKAENVAPDDHHTLVQQGRTLTDLGRLDEAEHVLRRAVRVRDAAAEYNLGNVLDRQGRWDEARGRYERALAIDPFHARALNNLGLGYAQRGQTPAALALFRRATEAGPDNAEAWSNLGVALLDVGRRSDAIAAIRTAIALAPSADAHNNLGIALAQEGWLKEAADEFRAALKIVPNHVSARRNLEQVSRE